MPGPKPRRPKAPKLNPLILDMLKALAWLEVNLRLGLRAGQLTRLTYDSSLQKGFDAIVSEAGVKLEKAGRGRPKELDKVIRRLMVHRQIDARATVLGSLERVGAIQLVIEELDGSERRSGPFESFEKHFHRDRKREAATDGYMEYFEAACRRYERDLTAE